MQNLDSLKYADIRLVSLVIAYRHVKNTDAPLNLTFHEICRELKNHDHVVHTANDPQVVEAFQSSGMSVARAVLVKLIGN